MITDVLTAAIEPYLRPYREALNPLWTSSPRGVIETIRPLTPTASAVTIRVNRAWRGHRAGQFTTVGVDIDGVRHQRCYSITSAAAPSAAPGRADTIEIAVQRVDGGVVSTHLTSAARPGDLVHLTPADGDFVLPVVVPERLLFVTGGSGITPVMGMLRTLAAGPPLADVVLLHHAPTADTTMFAAELAELERTRSWLTVRLVHTQGGGDRLDAARLDAARLDRMVPDWRERDTYVCGPAPLIDFATDHWADASLLDRLHLERFTLALPHLDDALRPAGTVSAAFARSNVVAATDGATTLLDVAEANGLAPAYGCRTGVCHTCSTRLIGGCTRDVRDGRTTDAGAHVQLCVSVPVGDVHLDL